MILDTLAPVIPHLRHIAIDEARLHEVCTQAAPCIACSYFSLSVSPSLSRE